MIQKINQYKFPDCVYPFASDLTLPSVPRFTRLSGSLTRIASPAGVTYLKQSSVKSSVYLGSKYHAVDIEGIPWEKKTELKKHNGLRNKVYKKKLAPVETGAANKFINVNPVQISENLSTTQPDLLTKYPEISTKKAYKIKKSLVRNRLLAYTNTKNGSKCLYFFTVSFPVGMPEGMGYRALNTWFTSLRKQRLLLEYLWVAERQKNGTIHFHIAVPHFMRVWHVNGIMRKILLAYTLKKELPFSPAQFARGKYNGVDIAGRKTGPGGKTGPKIPTNFAHKKKAGSLANYLTKYITKNNEAFEHLAWHNSRGFSALFYSVALSRESFQMTGLHNKLNWSKKFENEHFVFVPWYGNSPPEFWAELADVNSFFQSFDYSANGKGYSIDYSNNSLKKSTMWAKENSYQASVSESQETILNNERVMISAFMRYAGKSGFSKKFCDEMREMIIERVAYIGMQKEFSDLLILIDKEHNDPAFFYPYHLYCYWAIDLLNQIPNN